MVDNREYVHLKRLEADYRALQRLEGSIITWVADPNHTVVGSYPSKYLITYHMLAPTVDGEFRKHVLEVDCSSIDYPLRFLPQVKFRTPVIKHPHIYSDGSRRICLGGFPLSEDLAKMSIRLARFFQYDHSLIDTRSLASREFYDWYIANRHRLPLDHSPLPSLADDINGFKVVKKTSIENSNTFRITKKNN